MTLSSVLSMLEFVGSCACPFWRPGQVLIWVVVRWRAQLGSNGQGSE